MKNHKFFNIYYENKIIGGITMKRKNETITLKAALVITAATIIILCSMLVNVKADQKPESNFQPYSYG